MAKAGYNTFVVCGGGEVLLVTSSAKKARAMLDGDRSIGVWRDNSRVAAFCAGQRDRMQPYINSEREHHRRKQQNAEVRNAMRRIMR